MNKNALIAMSLVGGVISCSLLDPYTEWTKYTLFLNGNGETAGPNIEQDENVIAQYRGTDYEIVQAGVPFELRIKARGEPRSGELRGIGFSMGRTTTNDGLLVWTPTVFDEINGEYYAAADVQFLSGVCDEVNNCESVPINYYAIIERESGAVAVSKEDAGTIVLQCGSCSSKKCQQAYREAGKVCSEECTEEKLIGSPCAERCCDFVDCSDPDDPDRAPCCDYVECPQEGPACPDGEETFRYLLDIEEGIIPCPASIPLCENIDLDSCSVSF